MRIPRLLVFSLAASLGCASGQAFAQGCVTATGTGVVQNAAFPAQTGSFTATFDATPLAASINSTVGLSNGAQSSTTGLAAIVRFNTNGRIDARNGGGYAADAVIPYSANLTYRFRLEVSVPAHTYSIFVTPPGAAERTVGTNFAFRSEQSGVTSLSSRGVWSGSGSNRVCNLIVTPSGGGGGAACPTCTHKRLKIVNGCGQPMWVFYQTGFQGGVLNAPNRHRLGGLGSFIEYDIPDKGLAGVRFWPGMGCDATGNNCLIGASGGPASDGFTCPAMIGCAPAVDSKFEGTFGCISPIASGQCQQNPSAPPGTPLPRDDFWDTSMVDGYTLPLRLVVRGTCPLGNPGGPPGGVIDCSTLRFSDCPQNEDLSTNGQFPALGNQNLLLRHPNTNQIVGCYSPVAKLTFVHWQSLPRPPFFGTTFAPTDPQARMYACPTPPVSVEQCRTGPVINTDFVNLIHNRCNNTYAYAYDDVAGLSRCPAATNVSYEVTFFCPQ